MKKKFMFCSAAFNLGEYYSNQLKQNEKKDKIGKYIPLESNKKLREVHVFTFGYVFQSNFNFIEK